MATKLLTSIRSFDMFAFGRVNLLHIELVLLLTCMSCTSNADTTHAYLAETNSVHGQKSSDQHTKDIQPAAECLEDLEGENCQALDGGLEDTHVSESSVGKSEWDPNGYILFCPCMGRFGNQAEHYLGAMAFAKALNRTLVMPPFRTFAHASFGELFEVEPVHEFHRIILMEDFMQHLAPKYWPPGKRTGYAHLPAKDDVPCRIKDGNPFGPFWNHFNIDFDECVKYQLHNFAHIDDDNSMKKTKQVWDDRLPPKDHPVLALRGSPGSYPIFAGNRALQKYLKWNPTFFKDAGKYIEDTFHDEGFVGIHLRNGIDWVRACENIDEKGFRRFMASPQCLDKTPEAVVTMEVCLPSLPHVLQHTSDVFNHVKAKHLFIATDKNPYLEEFRSYLQPQGVTVHYKKPNLVEMDLMILGQADYFIGNCVSSFTSFVKRERDASGRPSAFFGQDLIF